MSFGAHGGNVQNTRRPHTPPKHAGFWLRFIAYSIDSSIVTILTYLIAATLFVGSASVGALLGALLDPITQPLLQSSASSFAGLVIGLLVAFIVFVVISFFGCLFYATLFEGSKLQATPGKLIVGLRVSNTYHLSLGYLGAFMRNLAKVLSYLTLFVGFVMAAFTPRKQALHDLVSGTLVLRDRNLSWKRIILSIVLAAGLSTYAKSLTGDNKNDSLSSQHSIRSLFSTANNSPQQPQKSASSIIKYIDDKGNAHYVTHLDLVPENYQDRIIENADLPEIQRFSNWSKKPSKPTDSDR